MGFKSQKLKGLIMNRKLRGILIGAAIGGGLAAICSQTVLAIVAGAVVGGFLGFVVVLGSIRMDSERESGATW